MNSFTFNGIRNDNVWILKGKKIPVLAPRSHQFQTIPKLAGALLMGTTTGVRSIELPVAVKRENYTSFSKLKEELATWLTTDEEAPLILDEDKERTYFALLDSISDPEEIGDELLGVNIVFVCPDPFKYSDERRIKIYSSPINGINNIDVLGNKETYPIFKLEVAKNLNYFSVISQDDYIQIGTPEAIDEPTYEPETIIFTDDMSSTTGWTSADYVDNGHITGQIQSTGEWFYPALVGTTVEEGVWQGPSLKKSIGTALTNFRAQINLALFNTPEIRTGMIEIYFLNASNETVCKIGIEDRFAATNNVLAKAAIGGTANRTWIHSGGAGKSEWWDNYSGIMRIERINNYWTVYFSTIDANGVHTRPRGTGGILNYNDIQGVYADEITQVQVSFRLMPGSEKADMRVHGLTIWEINDQPQPTSLPIIALAGDVLEIDHYENTVRKNGEIVQGIKDFGSNFFPLKKGRNRITIQPPDAGDLTVTYRERYL